MKGLNELKAEVRQMNESCYDDDGVGAINYLADCQRIKKLIAATWSLDWSLMEVQEIWYSISDERDAGWLNPPRQDSDLLEYITDHCE